MGARLSITTYSTEFTRMGQYMHNLSRYLGYVYKEQ